MQYIEVVSMHSHYHLAKTTSTTGTGIPTKDDKLRSNEPGHVHHMVGRPRLTTGMYTNTAMSPDRLYVGGKHYHMYCAVTKVADGHVHKYEDATHK